MLHTIFFLFGGQKIDWFAPQGAKNALFNPLVEKNNFFSLRNLKTSIFHKNLKSNFSHKTNTFSYDEFIKIRFLRYDWAKKSVKI